MISAPIRRMFSKLVEAPPSPGPAHAPATLRKADTPHATHVEHPPTNIQTEGLVVMEAGNDFTLVPITLDEVRPDELLIEMVYSGICHTDVVVQQGLLPIIDFPAILGHEGAGIVRGVGRDVRDKSLQVGSHVLLSFTTCGNCRQCKKGHPALCHDHPQVNHSAVRQCDQSTPARLADGQSVRSQYFGHSSFARMSVVNENCVVKVHPQNHLPIYAPLGCGFQTGAGTILNVLRPTAEDSVCIFGLGSVGLTALLAAVYCRTRTIIAVDIQDTKLDMARQLGATHTINSKDCVDVVQKVKEKTQGGADFAVECTGAIPVIETTVDCLAPRGTAACVGVPKKNCKVQIDPLNFLLDNKTLIGVVEGYSVPKTLIPELIKLHRAGHFPIERLCHVYSVKDIQQAMSDLASGKVIKPIIHWD